MVAEYRGKMPPHVPVHQPDHGHTIRPGLSAERKSREHQDRQNAFHNGESHDDMQPVSGLPPAIARKTASATSLPRSPTSPGGPTHAGHPASHAHASTSSRVRASRRNVSRYSGALNPTPPEYASYRYRFGCHASATPATSSVSATPRS